MTAAGFIAWRKAAGLSQQAAARALGMGLRQLRAIEQGDPEATVRRTIALAVQALAAGLED